MLSCNTDDFPKRGTTWQHIPSHQAKQAYRPSFWVFDELSGGDEHPLGDTNHFGSFWYFLSFGIFLIGEKCKANY